MLIVLIYLSKERRKEMFRKKHIEKKEKTATYEDAMEMLLNNPEYLEELSKENPGIKGELEEYVAFKKELSDKINAADSKVEYDFEEKKPTKRATKKTSKTTKELAR